MARNELSSSSYFRSPTTTTINETENTNDANDACKNLSNAMENGLRLGNDDDDGPSDEARRTVVVEDVVEASYPVPEPLSRVLKCAAVIDGRSDSEEVRRGLSIPEDRELRAVVEPVETALSRLLANAFQALDDAFFAAPSSVRNRASFAHRSCLRVSTDAAKGTLRVTDLGCGMTRADLINSLGVGRPLSSSARRASDALSSRATGPRRRAEDGTKDDDDDDRGDDDDGSDDDGSDDNDSSTDDFSSSSDEDSATSDTVGDGDDDDGVLAVPCGRADVGGFYAAFCSLGSSVRVNTKSRHDDYYRFELGPDRSSFSVRRPHPEGFRPAADNGHGAFHDVRGDNGTEVVLVLNQRAREAGMLDEQNVLKPMLTRILETSRYSVAFSTDDPASVKAIVDASAEEDRDHDDNEGNEGVEDDVVDDDENENTPKNTLNTSSSTVLERSKYIPVRLSLAERKMLRLVEATMACSDYTTVADDPRIKSPARRTHARLKAVAAVLRGMVLACDRSSGRKLAEEGNFSDYEEFFRSSFEIARRHKIMNPEKMRSEYGKLIYLLQDVVSPDLRPHLGIDVKGPILTVHRFLLERNGLALLSDPLIETATQEILAEKKSRAKIAAEIKRKEKAVSALKQKYRTSSLSSDDIHLCLYSICDNNSFLNSNRVPIDKVVAWLRSEFDPDNAVPGDSLGIVSGEDGARLSHSHRRQYHFALQSLTLWRDIVDDMFRLWHTQEEDLLSDAVSYVLKDTGQGAQRVQQSPRTYRAMRGILAGAQSKVRVWIGSSVVHLGDHNVPNALSFVDKYAQVPRILGPIVSCLENLERATREDDGVRRYVDDAFGGLARARRDVLRDFFRSAFDGSGADNFYDAGSCVDGRLTSAWNWCSRLSTKRYYALFKLTGFTGFDGEFK